MRMVFLFGIVGVETESVKGRVRVRPRVEKSDEGVFGMRGL
jgi:hypothetical protein